MSTHEKIRLGRGHVRELLTAMMRVRMFEDKCAELYTQEEIRGFLHLYDGEEAIAAGVIPVLAEGDRIVATYREHGHALVRGVSMNAVMAEMFGKAEGCSGGAAARCICMTRRPTSMAATRLSAAGCRWRRGWRWPIICAAIPI
ncbi:thiamine pyrophosphate-dependent enzyme [Leisingera aquimarina]|uniref:thiamine pyrophosphate-dependent enzyme n=1 Tax=Leisingera aquimarina TaxID=476529 RepID=UPI00041A34B1|nr:thiamine pyrophosphate-dependent enzyme [Leisingera aquimarina]